MIARTMEDLNDYMLLHGHKELGNFELTDELIEVIKDINDIEVPFKNGSRFNYIFKGSMKRDAYDFYNKLYNIHEVGYLSDKKLSRLLNDKHILSIDDVINYFNKAAKMINPFDLPIIYNIDNVNGGRLKTQVLVTEDHDYFEELLPKLNLYFTGIYLPKTTSDISTASYIHELTHSQLESNKGTIEEFHNAEVISIFNELLYAYCRNKDLFYYLLITRINGILLNFNSIYEYKTNESGENILEDRTYTEFDYHTDIKYLTSTLKAFKLLALYIGNSKSAKDYIIHQINSAMDGYRSLEESLNNVNVTYDNSLNSDYVRRLI